MKNASLLAVQQIPEDTPYTKERLHRFRNMMKMCLDHWQHESRRLEESDDFIAYNIKYFGDALNECNRRLTKIDKREARAKAKAEAEALVKNEDLEEI